MTIAKNSEKGNCPFRNLEVCDESCVFYRKGIRYKDDGSDPVPFEECAINIIADNLEAMHNRTAMMQSEVGETKNVMAFKVLSDLGMMDPNLAAQKAAKLIKLPDADNVASDKKLIK